MTSFFPRSQLSAVATMSRFFSVEGACVSFVFVIAILIHIDRGDLLGFVKALEHARRRFDRLLKRVAPLLELLGGQIRWFCLDLSLLLQKFRQQMLRLLARLGEELYRFGVGGIHGGD